MESVENTGTRIRGILFLGILGYHCGANVYGLKGLDKSIGRFKGP